MSQTGATMNGGSATTDSPQSGDVQLYNDRQTVLPLAVIERSPGLVYMQLHDRIMVRAYNQTASAITLGIKGRIMLPNGEVKLYPYAMVAAANTLTTQFFDLAEGFLLDMAVINTGAALSRGAVFVQAGLARGNATNFDQSALLVSDYLTGTQAIGWPFSTLHGSADGQGLVTSLAVGNPAAGADWSTTIPAGQRWRLRGIVAQLATSASVANRTPLFEISDGVANVYLNQTLVLQTASQTVAYVGGAYPAQGFATPTVQTIPLPPDLLLGPGYQIKSLTTNIQAGDQWSAIRIAYEQYVDNQ